MEIVQEVFWELLGDLVTPALFVAGFIGLAVVSCVVLMKLEKKRSD